MTQAPTPEFHPLGPVSWPCLDAISFMPQIEREAGLGNHQEPLSHTKEHLFSRTCSLLFLELVIAFVLYVCDCLSPSSSSGTNYPKQEQLLPGCASDSSFFSTQDSCDVAPVSWVQVSCLLVCAFVLGIHTPRAFPEKVFSFTLLCDRWSD